MKYLLLFVACFSIIKAQSQSEDAYTRYELLDPSSQSFRILFEVTSAEAGATSYYNTLRKGSVHQVDAVIDLATGQALKWQIVNGVEAKKSGLNDASSDVDYLQVKLSRPVPPGGEYRLKIDKTYKDEKSYYTSADRIVFERSLGVKRNAVVLPFGYELVKCNYPSQVAQEEDGRIRISFINNGPAEVPLRVEGRKLNSMSPPTPGVRKAEPGDRGEGRNKSKARLGFTFSERAYQSREIVYFLQQPETHAFRLYHDYTETRVDMDRYVNIVRPGSKASNPSARNLDTGLALKVETLKGPDITQRKIDIGEPFTPETEVVIIWYNAIKKGESMRLRIEETYTDADRYVLDGNELVFDRSLGRPYNTVILPQGWFLTSSVIPATVSLSTDGLIQMDYTNPSPDEIDVLIKAKKTMISSYSMPTMKTLCIIGFLLNTLNTFAQSQNDIDFFTGKWEIMIKGTQNGDATVILVLDKGADGLIGSVQDANGAELSKIARIVVGRDKLNLQLVVQGQAVNIELVKKDDSHVTVRYGNNSAEGQRLY